MITSLLHAGGDPVAAGIALDGVKKLVTLKAIKHYGVYTQKRREAQQLAIDWFREHLKAGAVRGSKVSQ